MTNEVIIAKDNTHWANDQERLGNARLMHNNKSCVPNAIPEWIQRRYSQEFFKHIASSLPTSLTEAGYKLASPTLETMHFKTDNGKAAKTNGRTSPVNPKINIEIVTSFTEIIYTLSAEDTIKINLSGTITLHFEQFRLNDAENYRFNLTKKILDDDYKKTIGALKALEQLKSAIKSNGVVSSGLIELRGTLKSIAKDILEIIESDLDNLVDYTELLTETKTMQSRIINKDVRKNFAATLNAMNSKTFNEIYYQYAHAILKYEISNYNSKPELQKHAQTILTDFESIHMKGLIDTKICINVLEQTTSLLEDPSDETRQVDFANALQEVAALDDQFASFAAGGMVILLGASALTGTAFVAVAASLGVAGIKGLSVAMSLKLLKIYAAKHAVGNALGGTMTGVASLLRGYGLFPDSDIRNADQALHEMQASVTSLGNK